MNEHDESEGAAPPTVSVPALAGPERPAPKPFLYWAKRFLVCNPFYLVSAALLLFGMYRISVDRSLFTEEISQLAFNLTSLEFYEVLLVATAIFLASRRIWYDSTLLVGLENLFIFVPFILLSQVALISTHAIWVVCAVTTIIAMGRFGGLKRYFGELNLPPGLLLAGTALLMTNIGLLAAYRIVGDGKMGWVPDSGPDYRFSQFTWLVILPAALALANFLPHARENGSLLPQRRWLPAGFFSLWFIATGVHLYCLNYVYNFAFQAAMLVPALWMLAWTIYRRQPENFNWSSRVPQYALAVAALLIPLAAASTSGTKVFFTLTILNAVIFATMCLRDRENQFARHLLFAAAMLLVCGLPNEWLLIHPSHSSWQIILHRETLISAGIGIFLMFYIVLSRNPKAGILGAVLTAIMVVSAFARQEAAIHWAVQSGLVFLLLHSLRWEDNEQPGARAVRSLAAILWMLHTLVWVRSDAALWMPCIPGGIVLSAYLTKGFLRGRWDTFTLPAASIVTVLSGPGNALIGSLHSAPMGLLAVIGSFLLFALGTAVALTKHHWHRTSA